MYKHILLTTDGSELAQKGVDHGLGLAAEMGARVTIITVSDFFPILSDPLGMGAVEGGAQLAVYETSQRERAETLLASLKQDAAARGVEADTRYVPHAAPAEAIVEVARASGCDLIVMASHGRRGLGRLLLGSQTSEVVTHSPIPVLVVR